MSDFRSEARVPAGSAQGGEWTAGGYSRSDNSKRTYKAATREKQQMADASEKHVALILNRQRTDDNSPMDTIVLHNGKTLGVEVKTIIDKEARDQVTMHKDSLARKMQWVHANHASAHTVAVDMRGAEAKVYYRRGFGSYKLHTMIPVNSPAHLMQLMGLI